MKTFNGRLKTTEAYHRHIAVNTRETNDKM